MDIDRKNTMEFLDGFKAVEPSKFLKRAVSAVQGFLAVGNTTELCLSTRHPEADRGAEAMLSAQLRQEASDY